MNSSSRGQNRRSGQCRNANQQEGGGETNRLLEREEQSSRKGESIEPGPYLLITR